MLSSLNLALLHRGFRVKSSVKLISHMNKERKSLPEVFRMKPNDLNRHNKSENYKDFLTISLVSITQSNQQSSVPGKLSHKKLIVAKAIQTNVHTCFCCKSDKCFTKFTVKASRKSKPTILSYPNGWRHS